MQEKKMLNRKLISFLVIFQILSNESKGTFHRNLFLLKLVNHTQPISDQNVEKKYKLVEVNHADLKWKYKCMEANELKPKFVGQTQARFIDQGTNDSMEISEMEAPVGKFSIFNLLSEEEDEDDDDDDDDDEDTKKGDEGVVGNEGEEDNNENEVFNFFDSDQDIDLDKLEGTKDESFLKQYHRQTLRMNNLMFPLLLAYKLKFFTVIPLLLGSLVLLVGTTGVAGFFFALFAAALGIHVKSEPP